jgi:Tol biopolymer transport system component
MDTTGDAGGMPVLSPQGDKIAFVAHSGETKLVFVRSLSGDSARALDGTAGASHPFWSPDGHYVGFFAGGKLMKIPATGGPAVAVADAPNPRGGSWGANDVIVFAPDIQTALLKVSAQGGGTAVPATALDGTRHSTHRWPWFLPDGKHFIFLATSHAGGDPKQNGIYFGSVDSTDTHLVIATDSAAQYASGYLLYRAAAALVAQPFDPQAGSLSGTPTQLVNNLRDDVGVWRSIFAVSQNGVMVYQLGSADSAKSHLVLFDRSGKTLADYDPYEATITNTRALLGVRDVRLSPDNKRVAFASGDGIWTLDLARKSRTRITFDEQVAQEPAWSPDGKTLLFALQVTTGGGSFDIRSKAADGSGAEKTLSAKPTAYVLPGWSPDGKYLTYLCCQGQPMVSLWILPATGDGQPLEIVKPPSPKSKLYTYRISPDGHWVAYDSDESGQSEIYVTSFPEGKGKWRISSNGGAYPVWSGDSKEVFYRGLTDDILVCPVVPKGTELDVGTAQRLFHAAQPGTGISFDVTSDGKRLLVNHAEEAVQTPLQLVTNWPAELKK